MVNGSGKIEKLRRYLGCFLPYSRAISFGAVLQYSLSVVLLLITDTMYPSFFHSGQMSRPTLSAVSTAAAYSPRSRTPPSAAAPASPAASGLLASNGGGGVSSHSQPNLGGSINTTRLTGGDFLDVAAPSAAADAAGGGATGDRFPRKCSTASATILDLYGNSSQLGNRSMQRDIMAARTSAASAPGARLPSGAGAGSPGADPRKSRKFMNQWKQAASLTKIGSREEEAVKADYSERRRGRKRFRALMHFCRAKKVGAVF